jgi:uncharacterized protein (TIGR03067 family)
MSQASPERLASLNRSRCLWKWLALRGWVAVAVLLVAWLAEWANHRAATAQAELLQERADEVEDLRWQNDTWQQEVRTLREREDLRALQGVWSLEWTDRHGVLLPEDLICIAFTGNSFAFTGKVIVAEALLCGRATFTLDPMASPRAIECRYEKCDDIDRGIYELKGDRLRICWNKGKKRPATFSADGGEPNTLWSLKRIAERPRSAGANGVFGGRFRPPGGFGGGGR